MNFLKRQKLLFSISILAICLICSVAQAFSFFSSKYPDKAEISFALKFPQIGLDKHSKRQKLIISFKNSGSPVRLKNEVKGQYTKHIRIFPHIDGSWSWKNDHELQLNIYEQLKSNTDYEIKISSALFSKKVEIIDNKANFKTPDLQCVTAKKEFYINPVDSHDTKIVAKIKCNYPIASEDINQKITLELNDQPQKLDIDFSQDKKHLTLISEKINITEEEHYANLHILPNLQDVYGTYLDKEINFQVKVPSVETIFQISNISTRIVRKNDAVRTPEQVLNIEASLPFKGTDLLNYVELYLLPLHGRHDEKSLEDRRIPIEKIPPANASDFNRVYSFRYYVSDKHRQVLVKIRPGLETETGYKTKVQFNKTMHVPEYPQEAKIIGQGTILNLKGDKKLSFSTLGNRQVRVKIKRMLPEQIIHLISQTNGDLNKPNFSSYNFNSDNITESFSEIKDFPFSHRQQIDYSHIDLGAYLKSKQGVFFLELDNGAKYSKSFDKRFIIATDIGFFVKRDVKNNLNIFVSSISSQQPLIGAKVEILGRNGLPLVSKITGANGAVKFADLKHYEHEKTPTAILITYGQDLAFMAYNSRHNINYSDFSIGGVHTKHNRHNAKKNLAAYIFTDRDLYRPGEQVNLVSIIKKKDFSPVESLPLSVEIVNPANKLVFKKALKLPVGGIFDIEFPTEYSFATGLYKANIYLVNWQSNYKRKELLGSKKFSLAEFQPDKIKITANFLATASNNSSWSKLKNINANVLLEHMYGSAVQDSLVKAKLTVTPVGFFSSKYGDYDFNNPLYNQQKDAKLKSKIDLPDKYTNQDGIANFTLDFSNLAKGFYKAVFQAEGFAEENGKSVKGQRAILLSSYDYLVGYKSEGRLNYINANSRRVVDFIAINNKQEPVELKNLQVEILKEKYVSTLVKDARGLYKYQSISKEELYKAYGFTLAKSGAKYALPTKEAGKYILLLKNQQGEVLSKIRYKIVGEHNLDFALEHNSNLDVTPNKSSYKNGETISLNINAPYKGYGLITIEKDKVYSHKWFKADKNSSVQHITVPAGIEGNAYVNIALVRSLQDKEIYTAPLANAIVPFKIDRSDRKIEIDLQMPEIIRPNEQVSIKYKLSRPGKIIIFGVDQGILQLSNYKVPDPLGFFFKKQALEVRTAQILDLLLPEYNIIQSLSAPGGGMQAEFSAEQALSRQLNPFKRRDLEPAVMWSGILDARSKQGEFNFKMPAHFNGGLKVMAVAVNDFALGSVAKDILVRAPIIINPSAPTNITPGDKFNITVSLTNNISSNDQQADKLVWQISTTDALKTIGATMGEVLLQKGESKKFNIEAVAADKLGAEEINIKAQTADGLEVNNYTLTLSIRPVNHYMTKVISGVSDKSKIGLKLQNDFYADLADYKFSVASTPLIFAKNLGNFLDKYPFACSEQISSKLFSYVNLSKFAPQMIQVEDAHQLFLQGINKLRSRQNADGSLSLWDNQNIADDFVTIYVAHLLLEASDRYFPVAHSFKESVIKRLHVYLEKTPASLTEARLQAYAAYLLTRNGFIVTPYLLDIEDYLQKNIENYQQDIAAVYLASTYRLLKDRSNAARLIKNYQFLQSDAKQGYLYYEDNYAYDAQYLYLLAKHFPDRAAKITVAQIQEFLRPISEQKYNSLSASYVILALSNFSEETIGDLGFALKVSDQDGKEISVDASNPYQINLPYTAKKIEIHNPNKALLFYASTNSGFLKMALGQESKELQISKTYLMANGEPATKLKLGDEVTVQVKVKLFRDLGIHSAVIVDLFPGGFEVVPNSLRLSKANFQEQREDRYIIYTSLSKDRTYEFSYKIKAINSGIFAVPASFASDMYDANLNGRSALGEKLIIE